MASWTPAANWKALVLAAGLTLAQGASAPAADLPPAPALPDATAQPEDFSGWYLRGDIGAGFANAPALGSDGSVAPGLALPALSPFAVSSFGGTTLTPSGTVDAGLGYVVLGPWLRVDGTLEYRFGGRLQSSYAIGDPAPLAGGGPFRAVDSLRASVSSMVALVNGYVDLGDYWGIKPFVGAGIGVADNALSSVSDHGFAVSGAGAAVPVSGFFSNAARTRFAWALTAGLDFDIASDLKLELSYRYLDLGAIAVGGLHCVPGGGPACVSGATAVASSRRALASSDLRIGLIWLIPDSQATPAPIAARY